MMGGVEVRVEVVGRSTGGGAVAALVQRLLVLLLLLEVLVVWVRVRVRTALKWRASGGCFSVKGRSVVHRTKLYHTHTHTHTQNNRNIKVISFFFQKRKFILVLRWCRDQSQQA